MKDFLIIAGIIIAGIFINAIFKSIENVLYPTIAVIIVGTGIYKLATIK